MREAVLAQARWELGSAHGAGAGGRPVEDRCATAGEWVDAGGIVVSLLPPGNVKVRFFVPEPELVGDPASARRSILRCDGCAAGHDRRPSASSRREAEFTPPVIYSVGSRGKLVFMVEAWPDGRHSRCTPASRWIDPRHAAAAMSSRSIGRRSSTCRI